MEIERGRLVWELLGRPTVEHAGEVWCTGGKTARKKLDSIQGRIGRRLLGCSATVAGVAVRGELGWWSLEERRERKKVLYGKRVVELGDERLVNRVVDHVSNVGGMGWWKEFEDLKEKYGGIEGSGSEVKKKIVRKVVDDWRSEVGDKVSLRNYELVKVGLEAEQYLGYLDSYESRVRFRLRTGSAGLMEDKMRCKMRSDARCVLCDDGVVEDIQHFLIGCVEFEGGRRELVEKIGGIVGAEGWIEEWNGVGEDGRGLLLLGKKVEGVDSEVAVEVDRSVGKAIARWWERRKRLVF
ncbi:hypothetical protein SPONN_2617 [uncultured Candidatus Thioglobus sp.]|nr:hypothetical protein SPONN_2617 [uncultured Candidatus Thioglobus sp.]